ncbi:MAG: TolB family protein [Thermoleophilia bacterium]
MLLLVLLGLLAVLFVGQSCREQVDEPWEVTWQVYGPQLLTEAQGLLAFDGTYLLDMTLRPVGSGGPLADPLFRLREVQVEGSIQSAEARSFEGTYAGMFGGMADGRVVWSASISREAPDSPREALDIYMFDRRTDYTIRLSDDDRPDIEPAISGKWIGWTKETAKGEKESQIMLYDVEQEVLTEVSPASVADNYPALDRSNNLVWQRHTAGGWEVWHRDLTTGRDTRLGGPFAGTPEGPQPCVDQGNVVWVADTAGGRAVFSVDLATPDSARNARKLAEGPSIRRAILAGNLVAWEEFPETAGGSPRVVLLDLFRGSDYVLAEGEAFIPLDLIGLSENVAVFPAQGEGGFLGRAYDAESGTLSTVFETGLGSGAASQPLVAGKRIVWGIGNEQGGMDFRLAVQEPGS